MNKYLFLLAALIGLGLIPKAVQAAENASARAILILASPEKKASDPRLRDYVENLRRILPGNMESFSAAGEGSASLTVPGRTNVALAQGHRLEIETERAENNRVRLNVRWLNGGNLLLDQPMAAQRGTPAVLAGPKANGKDVWAVLLFVN